MPFGEKIYPDGYRFQQDNDPKHTANYTKTFMENHNINWWETPASSSDLNPIKMLWAEMKSFLRRKIKPSTKAELINGIKTFWRSVDVGKCNIYIDHISKVLPIVVERNGRASGH